MAEERRIRRLRAQMEDDTSLIQAALRDGYSARESPAAELRFIIQCDRMDVLCADFEQAYRDLLNTIENAEEDHDLQPDRVVNARFAALVIEALALRRQLHPPPPVEPVAAPQPPLPTPPSVRLPKITLPHFSGEFKAWESFKNLYNTLIHTNAHLSEVEKFQYLSSCLVGNAKHCIAAFQLSAENYPLAYNALTSKYGSPRRLATHHLEAMLHGKLSGRRGGLRELLNSYQEHIAMLNNMDLHLEGLSDLIIFHSLFSKLEVQTREAFERTQTDSNAIPSFQALRLFLEKECDAQEIAHINSQKPTSPPIKPPPAPSASRRAHTFTGTVAANRSQEGPQCPICPGKHQVFLCERFRGLSVVERRQRIGAAARCYNCLGAHVVSQCPSKRRCSTCGQTHHTMLHLPQREATPSTTLAMFTRTSPPTPPSVEQAGCLSLITNTSSVSSAVLPTTLVEIADCNGRFHKIRALLDSGSMVSFVTASCVNRLQAPINPVRISVSGIGGCSYKNASGSASLKFRALQSGNLHRGEFVIIPKITNSMPSQPIPASEEISATPLQLADPTWNLPGPVDMLFGADIYPFLLRPGARRSLQNLSALPTIFGWVLMGSIPGNSVHAGFTEVSLDNALRRFWEIEEVPRVIPPSPNNVEAEEQYANSVSRLGNGRFMVALPFRKPQVPLGASKESADRRLLAMERRLSKDAALRGLYHDFMRDYLDERHMRPLAETEVPKDAYFIPHHGVFKTDEVYKKIRVVFDASAKTSNGTSLNDALLTGPKLQVNIVDLLQNFRMFPIVFSADIRQMYRQIVITPEHRKFQLIRWRFSEQQPIQTFQLETVTYGTSCAPFLAMRTIHQLAYEEKEKFPLGAHVLENATYVDDVLYSASDVATALLVKDELQKITAAGGFQLRKWSANHPDLLIDIPAEHRQTSPSSFAPIDDLTTKILGLRWHALADDFSFVVQPKSGPCTKRFILSEIARIYDPLGFLAPVTLLAKRFIQHLWTSGLGWDDTPPDDIVKAWTRLREELPHLSDVSIPRHVGIRDTIDEIQLHGFCDASASGYAAVIYVRIGFSPTAIVRLMIAKSRVAPLKRMSIPRLELQSAALLAELMDIAAAFYKRNNVKFKIFAWTDSMVALTWIRAPPYRWTTFVANRTAQIQERIPPDRWFHVRTNENAADPASRGMYPCEVLPLTLWWNGPAFLHSEPTEWPSQQRLPDTPSEAKEEEKTFSFHVREEQPSFIEAITSRFSSLRQLQRTFAYLRRFAFNAVSSQRNLPRKSGRLSQQELDDALKNIVRLLQKDVFATEIAAIRRNLPISRGILRLAPFIDEEGLLRVGGRLRHSELETSSKHPMLLPPKHHFSELVVKEVHVRNLHAGISTCQYLVLRKFWIISARYVIRKILSQCVRCFRVNPKSYTPAMADLPTPRVSVAKPFSRVGVDFGGPLLITLSRHRGVKSQKAYICLFVCFVTKALHLELVSDLTAAAFLAALRRFLSRRGRCEEFFSDCGTNFVGASKELKQLFRSAATTEGINWRFNPPAAPHFGGLWEGNMRCVKMHINRVIGAQILTYEELSTLLCQIEAVLNSRPLTPLSNDPNDLAPLTPGHFLTTAPLMAIPSPEEVVDASPAACLSRWKLVQRLHEGFWKRWKSEYLHSLQQRSKWLNQEEPPRIGTLVVMRDITSPLVWRLARVVQVHPGTDGVVRVATVQTAQGVFRRPLVKLCPLPGQPLQEL